jgi:hypothetical protein
MRSEKIFERTRQGIALSARTEESAWNYITSEKALISLHEMLAEDDDVTGMMLTTPTRGASGNHHK